MASAPYVESYVTDLLHFNDGGGGGVRQKFIFYTQKKITTSEIVSPIKIPPFLNIPKKIS